MSTRGLLLLAIVGAGAVYLWIEKPYLSWLRDSPKDEPGMPVDLPAGPMTAAPADGATSPDDAGWTRPPPPDGEYVEMTLLETPARYYGPAQEEHASDQTYRELTAALADDTGASAMAEVIYDRALARAAREVAYHIGLKGHPPPDPGLAFLLHASGSPAMSAAQFYTHSTSDQLDIVRDTVRRALTGELGRPGKGPFRVGIGEVFTPEGEYTRHVSVLVTRRAYDIERTPRNVRLGGVWRLRGRLPDDYRDPSGFALYPDGRMATLDVDVSGSSFTVRVPAGDEPGVVEVGIDGTDRRGPGKLFQLSVVVGDQLPRTSRVYVPALEPGFDHIQDAEAYAVTRLAADRARWGRSRLQVDDQLAAIARKHSEEMRDRGFFAHLSPTTGLAGERLQRAGYRATMHAENLAQNDTIGEAQAALMASVGHRKNILDDRPTHVGIGLAVRDEGERKVWYVTQLFAKPVVELDIDDARARLIARMLDQREQRELGPVAENERISAVAEEHAGAVADGELAGVARRALAGLSDMNVSMSASVHALYDLDTFELPEGALDQAVTEIGVGMVQSTDDAHGRIGVVLIFAHAPR